MSSTPDQMKADWLGRIGDATDLQALEALRVEALGKQGAVTQLLKTLGAMSADERQTAGPRIHALREAVTAALGDRKSALDAAELDARLARERVDVTLPAAPLPRGTVHPVSQVMDELAEIFADLGFAVATGPEIEDDWHNFTALNFPPDHPARAMHDTFLPRAARARRRADAAAHPHLARADPHDDDAKAADPHHRPGRVYRSTATPPTRPCSTRSRGW
jgi:phenylalanyl-tRNA synthetase alpha chain